MAVFDGTGAELTASAVGNPFGFACKRYDPTTALCHFGARWYDPALGRFLSPDPLGFVDGPNRYAYCAGDPVNFVDPWGLCAELTSLDRLRALWALTRIIQTAEAASRPAGGLDDLRAQLYDEFVAGPSRDLRESIQAFREDPGVLTAYELWDAASQAAATIAVFVPATGRVGSSSWAARRQAMREAGTPTSRAAVSQSGIQGRRQYVTEGADGSPRVQTQHLADRQHSRPHWHDGAPKIDPDTGGLLRNQHGEVRYRQQGSTTAPYDR
ncbi:MAG: RHS repeat-associated core domain-containing protein [Lentisphaerae bacterium]|nr:RHS repeat-associated core domain-containing protein [Lentisphaerota bacterium]